MDKKILEQYRDLMQEIKENRIEIENIEERIRKIDSDKSVSDLVIGGYGGKQSFIVKGCPDREYSKKKTLLIAKRAMLIKFETKLLKQENDIEKFIQSIDDSRMRRIIRKRFIDGFTWNQIADSMGGGNTEDSVKKTYYRFMETT